ncbi:MAG TPA: tail fiber domain-containing protein [Chitinophagaceae bacterium]|nr:tail fiber domain-containing protein [Chitinophagaceae bacterium]
MVTTSLPSNIFNFVFFISILSYQFISTFSIAQTPHAIPYQAVARNATGDLIANQAISLRLSIHDSSATGVVSFSETHTVSTNSLGLFTINIGAGTPLIGNFSSINWKQNAKFLQVELDALGGTNYSDMGTTQLQSVPYALYAKSSGDKAVNGLNKINDSIGLGGRINKETGISLDGNEMTIRDLNTSNIYNVVSQTLSPSFVNINTVPLTQTFLATGTVKLAEIGLYVSGLNATTITVSLKNSVGLILASVTNSYTAGSPHWSTFTFANSPLLNAGEIYTISVTGSAGTVWYYSNANPYSGGIASLGASSDFSFEVNQFSENGLLYLGNNTVGIGTDTPEGKLEVNGKTRTTQLQVTSNAGANKVLVSDATGNANWTATSTIASGTLDQAYNFGGAGSGRTITANDGAIKIAGTDGLLVTGTFGSGDNVELSGAGTRLFFNPKKAAFRVGYVNGTQWNNDSIGSYSSAFGRNTKAVGDNSIAMGSSTLAKGDNSIALGSNTLANEYSSTAMGASTRANGHISTAMGGGSEANGSWSTSMGASTHANGDYSTAMGDNTEANGDYSTAMGRGTSANGDYSTAMGYFIRANGDFSTAIGNGLTANGYGSFVIGRDNDSLLAPQTAITSTTPLFIIGNGNIVGNSSNAMVVRYDGKVAIGTNSPTHLLHVNGIARSTQSTWATASDKRVKKNIQLVQNTSLQKIMQLRPVTYEWIDEYAKASKGLKKYNTGFISQELEQVFPEMIEQVEEKFGDKTINDFRLLNLSDLPVHLVKAMQEQQKELDDLKKEIQTLKELIKHK